MGLFGKKVKSLKDSGLFEGFTDWHSHILPGVDDGIKTIEDSLKALEAYQELGFRKVWLTPHVMEDYPNETDFLKSKFSELKSVWTGDMEIALATENMLDTMFTSRLEKKDFLPIGTEGDHLLVETSYFTPPFGMDSMLENLRSAGYYPVLAHPERYRYMDEKDYKKLKEKGVKFQLNFLSLVGGYGEQAKKKAEWLLENEMVDLLGSDIHRLTPVLDAIMLSPSKSKHLENLKRLSENNIL